MFNPNNFIFQSVVCSTCYSNYKKFQYIDFRRVLCSNSKVCLIFLCSAKDDTNTFVVTWSTLESTQTPSIGGSWVEYGTNPRRLDRISADQEGKFVDGGSEHATQFIHRAVMGPLSPSTVYCKIFQLQVSLKVL